MWNRFKIMVSFALRDVSKSKMVLFFTVLSLSLSYAVVFFSAGILGGFQEALGSGSIDTGGYLTIKPVKGSSLDNVEDIEAILKKEPNVSGYSVRDYGSIGYWRDAKYKGSGYAVMGIDLASEQRTTQVPFRIIRGRFLQPGEEGSAVIGMTLADSLEGKLYDGKDIALGEKITLVGPEGKKKDFTLVGIIDGKYFHPNWTTYLTKSDLEYLDNGRRNNEIAVNLVKPELMEQTRLSLAQKIKTAAVVTWREREGYIFNFITAVSFITTNVSAILIFAVFVVTSVFIFINVFQRRRQIGILKSMGASNYFVCAIYVLETMIYSLLSFALGFLIFALINRYSSDNPIPMLIGDVRVIFVGGDILRAFAVLMGASLAGSLLPIYVAVKIQIADVIRGSI